MEKGIVQSLRQQVLRLKEDEKDYTELQYMLNNLQTRYSLAIQEKAKLQQESLNKIESMQRLVKQQKNENEMLRDEIQELSRIIEELKVQAKKQKELYNDNEISQQRYRRENEKLIQQNARLKDDNQDLQLEMRKLKDQRRILYERLDSYNRSLQQASQTKRTKDHELSKTEKQKRLLEKENKQLKTDIAHLQSKVDNLHNDLKQSEKLFSTALAKQLALQTAFNKMSSRCQVLQKEMTEARQQISQLINVNNQLNKQLTELQEQNTMRSQQNQQTTRDLHNQKREILRDITSKYEDEMKKLYNQLERTNLSAQQLCEIDLELRKVMQRKKAIKNAQQKVNREVRRAVDYLSQTLNSLS